MDMSTIYGAGVVGRYMSFHGLMRRVGSLLIAKCFGNIRTNARRGSKYGRINKGWQLQKRRRVRLTRYPIHSKKTLQDLNIPTEQIRFAVQSDINASGSYGEEWFILTDAAIFTVTGVGEVLHYIPYKSVLAIRAEVVVDAGLLVLETEEGTVDLIRYSNGFAPKFGFVARFIGDEIEFRNGKRDEAPIWDYKPEEHACKNCGRLLPDEFSPCPACTKKHKVMLRILSYIRPYRGRAILYILFLIVGTLITLAPPYFTRILVDDILALSEAPNAVPGASETWLGEIFRGIQPLTVALSVAVGMLLAIMVISTIFSVFQQRLGAWLTFRIAANIRAHVYQHLHNLSIRFFDKRTTGTVISHVTEDSERLQDFMLEGLSFLSVQLFLFFGIGGMLFLMNWRVACFVLIPIPIIVLGAGWFWKKVRSLWHRALAPPLKTL